MANRCLRDLFLQMPRRSHYQRFLIISSSWKIEIYSIILMVSIPSLHRSSSNCTVQDLVYPSSLPSIMLRSSYILTCCLSAQNRSLLPLNSFFNLAGSCMLCSSVFWNFPLSGVRMVEARSTANHVFESFTHAVYSWNQINGAAA